MAAKVYPQMGPLAGRFAGVIWDNVGTTKRPLGGAQTPLIQGASPTNKESTDA